MFEKFCRAPAPATAPNRAKFGKHCGATGSKDMRVFKARQRIPFGGRSRHVPPFPDRKTTSKKQVKHLKKETKKREKNTKKTLQKVKKTAKKHQKYQKNIATNTDKNQPESAKKRKQKHKKKCQKLV